MARLHSHLCDASGGLTYHWRAMRYRRSLWQPFVAQVAQWLASWQPPQTELLIVGPSAGYTLDANFLARFARITILEPDPLARWLLKQRFPYIDFHSAQLNCFASADASRLIAKAFPHSAILFSNVLGQKLSSLPAGWAQGLPQALQEHSWATYHDVIACTRAPQPAPARQAKTGESMENVLAGFWSVPATEVLEVFDHGSFGVLPAEVYATWSITPQQHHLVAWSSIRVEGSSSILPNTGMGGRS